VHLRNYIKDVSVNYPKIEGKINYLVKDVNSVDAWDVILKKNLRNHRTIFHIVNPMRVKVFNEFMIKWSTISTMSIVP
jgi:hypothetical protein